VVQSDAQMGVDQQLTKPAFAPDALTVTAPASRLAVSWK
jgi:hypothetical protein